MSLFNLFKKRNNENEEMDKEIRHTFNDEDRRISAEVRKIRAETKRVEAELYLEKARAELMRLKEELYGEQEEEEDKPNNSIETMLLSALMSGLFKNNLQNQQQNTPVINNAPKLDDLSDKDIIDIIKAFTTPFQRKKAKLLSDEQLKKLVKSQIPQISDNLMERGISLFRTI